MNIHYLLTAAAVISLLLICVYASDKPLVARLKTETLGSALPCNKTAWQTLGPERVGRERRRFTTVWKEQGQTAFFFSAKMGIDADGSPRAYNPTNTGLENNQNGKDAGRWVGIVLVNGRPYVQPAGAPAPGYYVSTTSLQDESKSITDTRRYVNSEDIPYIALSPFVMHDFKRCVRDKKACLGDIAYVLNSSNNKSAYAIVADKGPRKKAGEGSIALAKALGIPSSPRSGGVDKGVFYVVFPGSGNESFKSIQEINNIGQEYLNRWGGEEKLRTCLAPGN